MCTKTIEIVGKRPTRSTLNEVEQQLQNVMDSVSTWYSNDKLSLNIDKSSTMLIHSTQIKIDGKLNITVGGTTLNQVKVDIKCWVPNFELL